MCLCVCVFFLFKENLPNYLWLDDYSLEIRNVTRRDAGIYTVKCANDEGEGQTAIKLDVLCKTLMTQASFHPQTPSAFFNTLAVQIVIYTSIIVTRRNYFEEQKHTLHTLK